MRKPLFVDDHLYSLAMVTMYERSFPPFRLDAYLQLPLRGNRFSTRVTFPIQTFAMISIRSCVFAILVARICICVTRAARIIFTYVATSRARQFKTLNVCTRRFYTGEIVFNANFRDGAHCASSELRYNETNDDAYWRGDSPMWNEGKVVNRNIVAWHVIFVLPLLSQFLHGNRMRPEMRSFSLPFSLPLEAAVWQVSSFFDVNMTGISTDGIS